MFDSVFYVAFFFSEKKKKKKPEEANMKIESNMKSQSEIFKTKSAKMKITTSSKS